MRLLKSVSPIAATRARRVAMSPRILSRSAGVDTAPPSGNSSGRGLSGELRTPASHPPPTCLPATPDGASEPGSPLFGAPGVGSGEAVGSSSFGLSSTGAGRLSLGAAAGGLGLGLGLIGFLPRPNTRGGLAGQAMAQVEAKGP